MAHQMLVAMNVIDTHRYTRYRDAMSPILRQFGGRFVYDLVVSTVLQSPADHPITRLFSLEFPSRDDRDAFFASADYRRARAEHFEAAVDGYTVIVGFDTAAAAPSNRAPQT